MSTKAISLKLPTELLDRLKAKAEASGTTVTALLIDGVTGDAKRDPRVAELEAALVAQKALTAKWQKAAQSVMPMVDRKRVADLLPVAGDQFPEQMTWWQKQQLAKTKGR